LQSRQRNIACIKSPRCPGMILLPLSHLGHWLNKSTSLLGVLCSGAGGWRVTQTCGSHFQKTTVTSALRNLNQWTFSPTDIICSFLRTLSSTLLCPPRERVWGKPLPRLGRILSNFSERVRTICIRVRRAGRSGPQQVHGENMGI